MKVKLTNDNMITYFAVIVCCDTSHYITKDTLLDTDEFGCSICGEPLAFKSSHNGLWYTVGNRIFE